MKWPLVFDGKQPELNRRPDVTSNFNVDVGVNQTFSSHSVEKLVAFDINHLITLS